MKYYLLRPDGTYSDAGRYKVKPADRNDGQWIEGEPEGLQRSVPLTPFQAISAAFDALPLQSRKKLRGPLSEGFIAIQVGNLNSVSDIVQEMEAGPVTESESDFIDLVKLQLGVA